MFLRVRGVCSHIDQTSHVLSVSNTQLIQRCFIRDIREQLLQLRQRQIARRLRIKSNLSVSEHSVKKFGSNVQTRTAFLSALLPRRLEKFVLPPTSSTRCCHLCIPRFHIFPCSKCQHEIKCVESTLQSTFRIPLSSVEPEVENTCSATWSVLSPRVADSPSRKKKLF